MWCFFVVRYLIIIIFWLVISLKIYKKSDRLIFKVLCMTNNERSGVLWGSEFYCYICRRISWMQQDIFLYMNIWNHSSTACQMSRYSKSWLFMRFTLTSWDLCYPFVCKDTLLKKLSSNWRQISWCLSDLLKYLAVRRTPGVNRVWLGR